MMADSYGQVAGLLARANTQASDLVNVLGKHRVRDMDNILGDTLDDTLGEVIDTLHGVLIALGRLYTPLDDTPRNTLDEALGTLGEVISILGGVISTLDSNLRTVASAKLRRGRPSTNVGNTAWCWAVNDASTLFASLGTLITTLGILAATLGTLASTALPSTRGGHDA